jgi:hypothetical protein
VLKDYSLIDEWSTKIPVCANGLYFCEVAGTPWLMGLKGNMLTGSTTENFEQTIGRVTDEA